MMRPSRLADGRCSEPTPAVSRRGALDAVPRAGSIGSAQTLLLTEALAKAMTRDADVVGWKSWLVAEIVEADLAEARASDGRLEAAVNQIGRVHWVAFAVWEHEIVLALRAFQPPDLERME